MVGLPSRKSLSMKSKGQEGGKEKHSCLTLFFMVHSGLILSTGQKRPCYISESLELMSMQKIEWGTWSYTPSRFSTNFLITLIKLLLLESTVSSGFHPMKGLIRIGRKVWLHVEELPYAARRWFQPFRNG